MSLDTRDQDTIAVDHIEHANLDAVCNMSAGVAEPGSAAPRPRPLLPTKAWCLSVPAAQPLLLFSLRARCANLRGRHLFVLRNT